MALDPQIILGGKPAQIDTPEQTIAAFMKNQSLASDIALRNQQIEQSKQQAADIAEQVQQRHRQNDAQAKLSTILADPANHAKIRNGDLSPLWESGASPDVVNNVASGLSTAYKNALDLKKDQAAFHATGRELVKNALEGIDPKDDAVAAQQLNGAMQVIGKDHPELVQGWQPLQPGPNFRQQVKDIGANNLVAHAMLVDQAAQDKTAADTRKLNSEADNSAADAKKKGALLPGEITAQETTNEQNARTLAGTSDTGVTQKDQITEAETQRHNKATEAAERATHELAAKKFSMELGGDAVKGWAASIAQNPDAAASVPPALRTGVMQQFTKDTGLPFPKPLTGGAVDQERAARNTLDKVPRIQELMNDPEVKDRIGPILGRLGNVEQAAGTAIGLSASGEAKAQELRTLMRYMVFGEGKAVLGGRLPQQMMTALESSSPNVHMDPGTMQGAIKAVESSANDALDNADKQRFGGQMRSRDARSGLPQGAGKVIDKATAQKFYDAAGKDPAKAQALAEKNGWKVQ